MSGGGPADKPPEVEELELLLDEELFDDDELELLLELDELLDDELDEELELLLDEELLDELELLDEVPPLPVQVGRLKLPS
jgi:hypothetical protein